MRRKQKRLLFELVLLGISCVILSGCSLGDLNNSEDIELTDNLPVLEKEQNISSADIENIGIYLDVTPSMKGFLGMQPDQESEADEAYKELVPVTKYEICLNKIDIIIAKKTNAENRVYYRVDTPLWKTTENVLEKGREAAYYRNSSKLGGYEEVEGFSAEYEKERVKEYGSLCLTSALLNCTGNEFSVLITDFYENTGTLGEVVDALKANMGTAAGEKTIGIVGVRSEYAGIVQDIDSNGTKKPYGMIEKDTVEAEDICYRPFYVIVIGKPRAVEDFCREIQNEMNMGNDSFHCTVFYEEEINGMDFTNFKECPLRSMGGDGSDSDWKLWPADEIIINGKYSLDVYEYYDKGKEKKSFTVTYEVAGETLKKELEKGKKEMKELPGLEEMELIEVPCSTKNQEVSEWNSEKKYFQNADNFMDAFLVEGVYYSTEKEELYVVFKITKKLQKRTAWRLSGNLHLDVQNQTDAEWMEQWNMKEGEGDFTKTENLASYAEGIREQMPERERLLLNFVFYVKSE